MGPYRPPVRRDLDVSQRDNSRGALTPSTLPIRNQPVGVGFPHDAGIIDRGFARFRTPEVVGVVDVWKGF